MHGITQIVVFSRELYRHIIFYRSLSLLVSCPIDKHCGLVSFVFALYYCRD
ncbi:hypothetical protein APHCR_1452 [Anaplasma phagocytophilum str. CR1007]|nr:hypothetical protein APHCR_1452 [Anaplasma phagocytophilum str. CR1007]